MPFSALCASSPHRGAQGRDLTQHCGTGGPQFATLAVRQTPQHRTGFPVPLGWFPWGSAGRTCPELLETGEAQGWNTWTHGTRGAPSAPSAPSPFCSHVPRQDPKRPSLLQHPMLPPTPILPAGSCWPISTACPATDPCTCWCLDREFWGARMLPGFGWVLEVGPCPVPSYLVGTRLRDTGGRPQGRVAHCPPIAFSLPSRHIVTIPPLPPLPSRAAVRPRATFQPEHGHRWGTWGHGDRSRHRGGPSPEHPSPPRREQGVQQVQHGFLQVPRRCGGQHTVTHPLQRCPRPPQLPPYGPAPPQPHGIAKEVGNGMSVEVGIWDPTEGGMWDLHGCRDVRLSNSGRGR